MQIEYSDKFIKQLTKSPNQIKLAFKKRLALFIQDKYHPLLKNHALQGKLKGCNSINITGDWRAIFEEYSTKNLIIFLLFGTHSQLYK